MQEHAIKLLRNTVLFRSVPEALLVRMAEIAHLERVPKGQVIYQVGEPAKDLFVVSSGQVRHALGPGAQAAVLVKVVGEGDVIGWAALLRDRSRRLAKTTALEDTELLRIDAEELMRVLGQEPDAAKDVLERCARMIIDDFTVPAWLAQVQSPPAGRGGGGGATPRGVSAMGNMSLFMYRIAKWFQSPTPYLMVVGFGLFLGAWFLLSEVWEFWRFGLIPGPREVATEWMNPNPVFGLSIYTPEYYTHIWVSCRRILIAFTIATLVGVPIGLFLGWSKTFREYVFPVFETLRPIPVLAWVPLAIVMFASDEGPVLFLATLASFYATALNTMLGVESIDESYPRAAACLGASKWQIFRHVVIPGALPFIFTGLQISVGVAWFSLVAAEMVSGEFGLGYVINTSYTMVRYPTIVIGMITLGVVGYISSALVRVAGDMMMKWRVRELAMGGQQ